MRNEFPDKEYFQNVYKDIFETVLNFMNVKFSNLKSLKFLELLNYKYFENYKNQFPNNAFNSLKLCYSSLFDLNALQSQLRVVYMSDDFQGKSASGIIQFIISNGLQNAYNEVYNLSQLFLTLPVFTASVERSFSTLKRIKNLTRTTQSEARLCNLSMISIEKNLLRQLQKEKGFYDKVIDHFAQKPRRISLNYV